jgi:nucleoside-diphosphate-sugar epimerase
MTDLYLNSLEWEDESIDGRIFNAGYQNYRVREIAEMTRELVGADVQIVTTPTDDNRSYHISSEKIRQHLGYSPKRSIQDAVRDLVEAFKEGRIPNSMTDACYYNIRRMQAVELK